MQLWSSGCAGVLNLFLSRVANVADLDMKHERLARQWMVSVDRELAVLDP